MSLRVRASAVLGSDITPESVFYDRRRLLASAGGIALGAVLPHAPARADATPLAALAASRNARYSVDLKPTSFEDLYGDRKSVV